MAFLGQKCPQCLPCLFHSFFQRIVAIVLTLHLAKQLAYDISIYFFRKLYISKLLRVLDRYLSKYLQRHHHDKQTSLITLQSSQFFIFSFLSFLSVQLPWFPGNYACLYHIINAKTAAPILKGIIGSSFRSHSE